MTEDVRCYLYWIKSEDMSNFLTEGYVGISTTPHVRIKQHISNAKTDSHHKYPEEFKNVLLSGNYSFEVLVCGSIEYCMLIERKLRPMPYIGWNRAIGGDGGVVYKHGLTGSRTAKTYYNLLNKSKAEGEDFYEGWSGDGGLEQFSIFYQTLEEVDGEFTLKVKGGGYHPENLIKMTRSEIIRRAYRRYDIGDGSLYSVAELAEKFNLKPNTISVRMRDGWTTREAVGLDPRKTGRGLNAEM